MSITATTDRPGLESRTPRPTVGRPAAGSCTALVATLPRSAVVAGATVFVVGIAYRMLKLRTTTVGT